MLCYKETTLILTNICLLLYFPYTKNIPDHEERVYSTIHFSRCACWCFGLLLAKYVMAIPHRIASCGLRGYRFV